jgi:Mrp family chromosome partitioning ATPase/lysozyme family protein
VALCAGGGLLLGTVVLPAALPNQASYKTTVRLKVAQLVSDTIVREQPQFKSEEANGGGNALQDVVLADEILGRLGGLATGLTAKDVVNALTTSPIPGSSYVDLAYTDSDRARSARVVTAYAKAWASRRNAVDARRLRAAMSDLDRKEAELRGLVARLDAGTATSEVRKAELDQAQARLDTVVRLRNRMVKQRLFLGPPTAVLRTPVVTQLSAPTAPAQVLALGLLVGLLAGVGLALLTDAVRPKVLAPADVEHATRLPVIASVPPGGMRGGLPVLERPFSPAAEGFRRVAGALERRGLGDDVRVLAVASADRGEGRSLLAVNLAHQLARQGRDVILISGDLRRPALDGLVGLAGEPGLAEWLEEGERHELPLRLVADHLLVLPAGTTQRNPGELLTADRLRPGLEHLARTGLVVLIDTPPALSSSEAMALTVLADATLLVVRAGASRWRAIEHLAEALRRDGVQQIGTVLLGDRGRFSFLPQARFRLGRAGRHQAGANRRSEAISAITSRYPADDSGNGPVLPVAAARPGVGLPHRDR